MIVVVIGYALRLAPEDTSIELTGFEHNAVTCVGMKTDIPVSTCYMQLFTMYFVSFGTGIIFYVLMLQEFFLLDMILKILLL